MPPHVHRRARRGEEEDHSDQGNEEEEATTVPKIHVKTSMPGDIRSHYGLQTSIQSEQEYPIEAASMS